MGSRKCRGCGKFIRTTVSKDGMTGPSHGEEKHGLCHDCAPDCEGVCYP